MHRAILLFALATSTGLCDYTAASPSSTGGSGGVSTASACDGKNDCNACASCAMQGYCATAWTTCQEDSDCVAIDECIPTCSGDQSCISDCWTNNPNGSADYQAATACVYCTACPKDCAGRTTCQ